MKKCLVIMIACAVFCGELYGSDSLPRDPNNVYGRFDNGLSYIIRKHSNPPERLALYLHIKSGALNETAQQNGLAHFLEHMAFNGSEHYAPGELIPFMNKLGMQFGADSNAHTTYHETVYKLFMPDNKSETLGTALTIFSDYAQGLKLLVEEIDKERGVILEESRASKSAQERIWKAWMKSVFEGTRLAEHDVIGDEDQIKEFPREQFVDYWDAWYRPENMTLIVVGDIDPAVVVSQGATALGQFKGRGDSRKQKSAGVKPIKKPRAIVLSDPEQVSGQVQLIVIEAGRAPMKTFADFRFNEVENIGPWIVNRRLDDLVQKGDAAFFGAGTGVQSVFNESIISMATAVGQPEDWNKMVEQLVVEINRALAHGFSDSELALAKKELIAQAERAVETEATRDARSFVGGFASAVGLDEPIMSAQQYLDLLKRSLDTITASEVHRVFVDHYMTKAYTYVLTLPEKDGVALPSTEDVLSAANEAWARNTEALAEAKTVDTILSELPTPGVITHQHKDADLGITTATLSNGVVVHHRYMDYKKDQVWISVTLSGGQIEETEHNRGVSDVASLVNATSRMTSTQIRDFMTGKKVNVNGGVGMDAASISISGSPADIETGFQLAHAFLTDGKIEQSALDTWKKNQLQQLEQLQKVPQGQLIMAISDVFYGGDARYAQLTPEQIEGLTVEQGEQWMRKIIDKAFIEVAVVGDMQLDVAMPLVTRYLGSLPQRSVGAQDIDAMRVLKRGDGPYTKSVHFDSITPKAFVLAGFVGCDQHEIKDRRLLSMVAQIMSDRMIKKIREEQQLVYSVRCASRPAREIPGTGMIMAAAPTDPQNADKLADTILSMLSEFAEAGPTAEEVDIAKKQIKNDLDKRMKEPTFWLSQLGDLKYRGRSIDELKTVVSMYESFTIQELQQVAQKYMIPNRTVRFSAIPQEQDSQKNDVHDLKEPQPAG